MPVTVTVTCPTDNKTASDTVNIQVTRPPVRNYTFEDVHFDFDRYSLRPEATRVLDEAVAALQANADAADRDRRAHLQHRHGGIQPGARRPARERGAGLPGRAAASRADRLQTVSYGEERPKYDNAREETRRLNRRAALVGQSASKQTIDAETAKSAEIFSQRALRGLCRFRSAPSVPVAFRITSWPSRPRRPDRSTR